MFLSCSKNVLWLDPMNWYVIYCHMDISKKLWCKIFHLSIYLSFSFSLSIYLSLSHTRAHTHTHTYSLSLTHTHPHTVSVSHTHTHPHTVSLFLSLYFSLSQSLYINGRLVWAVESTLWPYSFIEQKMQLSQNGKYFEA